MTGAIIGIIILVLAASGMAALIWTEFKRKRG